MFFPPFPLPLLLKSLLSYLRIWPEESCWLATTEIRICHDAVRYPHLCAPTYLSSDQILHSLPLLPLTPSLAALNSVIREAKQCWGFIKNAAPTGQPASKETAEQTWGISKIIPMMWPNTLRMGNIKKEPSKRRCAPINIELIQKGQLQKSSSYDSEQQAKDVCWNLNDAKLKTSKRK